MRRIAVAVTTGAALIALAPCGFAQDAAKPAPQIYTLTLTGPEIAQIGAALGERKYNEVADLIAKIAGQFRAQGQMPKPAVSPAPPETPKEP